MKTSLALILGAVVLAVAAAGAYVVLAPGGAQTSADYRLAPSQASLGALPEPLSLRFHSLDIDTEAILASLGGARVTAGVAPEMDILPTPEPEVSLEGDAARLHAITKMWSYVSMSSMGGQTIGTFVDESPDVKQEIEVPQGETYKGVLVARLTRDAAVVELGDASDTLELNPYAHLFLDPKKILENPDLYKDEEYLEYAKARYMKLWGNEAKKRAESYVPKDNEIMPPLTPPSREEVEAAKQRYEETYGEYFRNRAQNYTPAPGAAIPTPLNYVQEQLNVLEYKRQVSETRSTPAPEGN